MNKKENGYIVLDELFSYIPKSFNSFKILNKKGITIEKIDRDSGTIVLSFFYDGKKYYYKYDKYYSPYNELVVAEIAKCLNIKTVTYQLASIGDFKGLLSEDYKIYGNKNIEGHFILEYYIEYLKNNGYIKDGDIPYMNNLQTIWESLEYYFKRVPKKEQIVANIMSDIIKMFVLDILTLQLDRHDCNWEIVEETNGNAYLQPLFDNIRISSTIIYGHYRLFQKLGVTEELEGTIRSIANFVRISSSEFNSILTDNLWIIDEDNINEIIKRIEESTNSPMSDNQKQEYQEYFKLVRKIIEEGIKLGKNEVRR